MLRSASTVRGQLLALVLVTMVPLLVFAATVVLWSSHISVSARREGLENTVRALALAVDGRIERWKAALSALATSPSLDAGDLTGLYEQARVVAQNEGGWIVVSSPTGRQLINTLKPYGFALPTSLAAELPAEILRDPVAHVSDLFVGPVAQGPVLSVTVQALRDARVTHAIHLGITPETLSDLLAQQRPPPGWIVGLADGQNRVIARHPHDPALVGRPVPEWLARGSERRARGVLRGTSLDGRDVHSAFIRLSQSNWTLALSVPHAEFQQAWLDPLLLLAGGGLLIVFGCISIAVRLIGTRLARPLDGLAAAARAATQGQPLPQLPAPAVRELDALQRAVIELSHMQLLLREANHRIKNSLQIVAASLGMQSRAVHDKATRARFDEVQAHIQAIARLHERLYRAGASDAVDAMVLAREICADVATMASSRCQFHVECDGEAVIDPNQASAFALILAELIINAVKHASDTEQGGDVSVRSRVEPRDSLSVTVVGSGPSLPLEFELAAQPGLGLRMCLALATQIGATLRLVPVGDTTGFELRLPLTDRPLQPIEQHDRSDGPDSGSHRLPVRRAEA